MSRRGETEDEAYDRYVQEYMDDETEARAENTERAAAKRRATQISAEELSLMDARIQGAEAGQRGRGPEMNPYDHGYPEHHEWERCRVQALSQHLARLVA